MTKRARDALGHVNAPRRGLEIAAKMLERLGGNGGRDRSSRETGA
jgi:hypothetical protein